MKNIHSNTVVRCFLILILSVFYTSGLMAQKEKSISFFNHTQVGVFVGEESADKEQKALVSSFQTINGIRLDENWAIGLGLGAEPFEYIVYPVFFTFYHYFAPDRKAAPYFSFKVGNSFTTSNKKLNNYYYQDSKHKGGIMCNPELGIRFKVSDYNMTLSGGYRFQRLKSSFSQSNTHYTINHQVDYNRVSFTLGIMF